jgi:hypothetical protein
MRELMIDDRNMADMLARRPTIEYRIKVRSFIKRVLSEGRVLCLIPSLLRNG